MRAAAARAHSPRDIAKPRCRDARAAGWAYWRPRFNRTPTIARRGSTKTVGRPKFGLAKLSVARLSSAVLLSALRRSSSSSTCVSDPSRMTLDTRTSSSDCDERRRDPPWLGQDALVALRQRNLRGRGPGLAAEVLKTGGDRDAGSGQIEGAHRAKHLRAIVRQAAVGVRQVIRIASERRGRERRRHGADLRIGGGRAARCLQSVRSRERIGAQCLPAV